MEKMDVKWEISPMDADHQYALNKYKRYLRDKGIKNSTIESYVIRVCKFLEFAGNKKHQIVDFESFIEYLLKRNLSRSSINNYCFAISHYYKMHGESTSFKFIRPNNSNPYHLEEDDVFRIFNSCRNLKHLAMLHVLFYGCLRASELCNLDDCDLDLKSRTIRIREAKGR